tara:strand:- start:302 stop:2242 length:1941 start_codon:yes stop_codon:yes gene_type:complete
MGTAMKKLVWIILCLLLVTSVLGGREVLLAESASIKTTISNTVNFVPTKGSHVLQDLTVDLFLVPQADERSVLSDLKISPEAEATSGGIEFKWRNPELTESFSVSGVVETSGRFVEVRDRIPFPLQNVPSDVKEYLAAGEIINVNDPSIKAKANELARGEDDAYVVVFKIGNWIQDNVDYSLDSLTAEAQQTASWVLQNRRGVCDEITALFISMLRSVGIPAKFISGMAYTDFNGKNDFGPHAWAEVWLPGAGWIGFDITYGEYGYVDAPHVKLKEQVDADATSTKFKWRGTNVEAETEELDIQTDILSIGGELPKLLEVKANAFKQSLGFGSYNVVEATVENKHDYYVITDLYVTKTEGVKVLDGFRKNVLLRPHEKKRFYWTVQLEEGLEEGFVYTFPVGVYTTRNSSSTIGFEAKRSYPTYSRADVEEYRGKFEKSDFKEISKGLAFSCSGPDSVKVGEQVSIECSVKNTGNAARDVNVCLDNCEMVSLGITEEKGVSFVTTAGEAGEETITVEADGEKYDVNVIVLGDAGMSVVVLDAPTTVRYDDSFDLLVRVSKNTFSVVSDVVITVEGTTSVNFVVDNLQDKVEIELPLFGSDVGKGMEVIVRYTGEGGRKEVRTSVMTELVDLTFGQKISLFFKGLFG